MTGQKGDRAALDLTDMDLVARWPKRGRYRNGFGVGQERIEAGTPKHSDVRAWGRRRAGHAETLGERRPHQVPLRALVDDPAVASGCGQRQVGIRERPTTFWGRSVAAALRRGGGNPGPQHNLGTGRSERLPRGQLAAAEAPLDAEPPLDPELEDAVDPLAEVGPLEPPVVDVEPPAVPAPLAEDPPLAEEAALDELPPLLVAPLERLLRESVR